MCRPKKLSWTATKYIDALEDDLDHEYRLTAQLETKIKTLTAKNERYREALVKISKGHDGSVIFYAKQALNPKDADEKENK